MDFWEYCRKLSKTVGQAQVVARCKVVQDCWYDGMPLYKAAETVRVGHTCDAEIIQLCQENQLIKAVKLYRDEAGCGLKEARDYVYNLIGKPIPL